MPTSLERRVLIKLNRRAATNGGQWNRQSGGGGALVAGRMFKDCK